MPPVIIGIGAIFGATISAATATAIAISLAINIAILGVSMLISYLTRPQAQTVTMQAISRQPVSYRRVIYGSNRVSGVMTYIGLSGGNNDYLHMVITLAGHQVQSITNAYIEGNVAHQGNSVQGSSLPYYQYEVDLGVPSNTSQPFPLLNAAIPAWDSTCLQRGNAKVHIALQFNQNTYPNGAPSSIAFDVLGKLLFDPRTSTTVYSDNAALVVRDWITDTKYGMGASSAVVDDTYTIAAANICDQSVAISTGNVATIGSCTHVNVTSGICTVTATNNLKVGSSVSLSGFTTATFLNGLTGVYVTAVNPAWFQFTISQANMDHSDSGTATMPSTQSRYKCDGVVDCGQPRGDILRGLLTAMGGYCIQPGDAWRIIAGAYVTPTIILTEDDLRGPIKMDTLVSLRDLANGINGTFVSPANNWQGSSFPPYQDATALATDNSQPIWQSIQLNFTTDGICAQRLAKIYLERIRRQKQLVLPCKLSAFPLQPGDTVMFTFPLFGFNQKVFEVQQTSIVLDSAASPIRFGVAQPGQGSDETSGNPAYTAQVPCIGVDLALREIDSNVFAWNPATDENTWLGPQQVTVPTPTVCQPPTSVTCTSGGGVAMVRADGLIQDRILVQWTSPADTFVLNGGSIEIYTSPHSANTFSLQGTAAGSDTEFYILNCVDGSAYDVLVFAINTAGVDSSGVQVNNITASGGTTTFGGNVGSVPAADIAALTTFAAYSGGTTYTPGMETLYSGNIYKCILTTTGNVPTNVTFWQLIGPQTLDNLTNGSTYGKVNNTSLSSGVPYTFLGTWSSLTAYVIGNEVSYLGNYWLCILGNTNVTPSLSAGTHWNLVGTSSLFIGNYSGSVAYIPGNEVMYNNNFYSCIAATTGNIPTNVSFWQAVSGNNTFDGVCASGNSTAWYKVGTLVFGGAGQSASFDFISGNGFNTNTNQQTVTTIVIRNGNNSAAPNLSGITWSENGGAGTTAVLAVKAAATGGSTSVSNLSWDIYFEVNLFAAGTLVANLSPSMSFTLSNTVSSDPGVASSTVVVGIGGFGLNGINNGPTNFSATASGLTYRPTSNPLTGHDAGSNATVNIAAFTMLTSGNGSISDSSGSVTGLSYATLYYIYYDDATLAGGAVTYNATTVKTNAINGAGRFFVGSITTPVSTGPDTTGNNDGGVGAQYGGTGVFTGSAFVAPFSSGGTVTNAINAIDNDLSTFAAVHIAPPSSGTAGQTFTISGLPATTASWTSLTLFVRSSVTLNNQSATLSYSLTSGGSPTNIYNLSSGTTRGITTDSVSLGVNQNLGLVQVEANAISSGPSGAGTTINIYGVWVIGVQ